MKLFLKTNDKEMKIKEEFVSKYTKNLKKMFTLRFQMFWLSQLMKIQELLTNAQKQQTKHRNKNFVSEERKSGESNVKKANLQNPFAFSNK